jgi:hypothetical protein
MGRTYKYGGAIWQAIANLEDQASPLPPNLPAGATRGEEHLWLMAVEEVTKMQAQYNQHVMTVFGLVWGQCLDALREKLRSKPEFEAINAPQNDLDLLHIICTVGFNHESNKFVAQSVAENTGKVWKCIQESNESDQAYMETDGLFPSRGMWFQLRCSRR